MKHYLSAIFAFVSTVPSIIHLTTRKSLCFPSDNDDSYVTSDLSDIRQGKIYIQHNFLNPTEVQALRNDIRQLCEHKHTPFQLSGLSNRVVGDSNLFDKSDRLTCTITPTLIRGDSQYSYIRSVVEEKLDALKVMLQSSLSSTNQDSLQFNLAEMYYSICPQGSSLPRHQDERHEEMKGDRAWSEDTRRSISWLIYLNEEWGANATHSYGGEFRAYCRPSFSGVRCGSHDGNLQVGWLRYTDIVKECGDLKVQFHPVFLDSWVKTSAENDCDDFQWYPSSALYQLSLHNSQSSIKPTQDSRQSLSHREYISKPFSIHSPSWPKETDLVNPFDFIQALKAQLFDDDFQERFVGLEDISDQDCKTVDIQPSAGTLVLFDSVVVPHEVLEVQTDKRLAIAGWYHEKIIPFPSWYGT